MSVYSFPVLLKCSFCVGVSITLVSKTSITQAKILLSQASCFSKYNLSTELLQLL